MVLIAEVFHRFEVRLSTLSVLLSLLAQLQEAKLTLLRLESLLLVKSLDPLPSLLDLIFEPVEVTLELRLKDLSHLVPSLLLLGLSLVLGRYDEVEIHPRPLVH